MGMTIFDLLALEEGIESHDLTLLPGNEFDDELKRGEVKSYKINLSRQSLKTALIITMSSYVGNANL